MLHLTLHVAVPVGVALALYRPAWRGAVLLMLAAMVIDLDHLVADPVYDPERCSIGFHPLHTWPAIMGYAAVMIVPLVFGRRRRSADPPAPVTEPPDRRTALRSLHLVGVGLLIHMALDGLDCLM